MFKNINLRIGITAAIVLASLFFLTPSITQNLPDFWKKNLPSDKIRLGLDLQGGTQLVLEVEANKAVETTLDRMSADLMESLMDSKIRFRRIEQSKGNAAVFELPDPPSRTAFEKILKDRYPELDVLSSVTRDGRDTVAMKIRDKRALEIKKQAVEQSIETLRNRVDQFGITEPEIIPQGEDRIVVQLPGIKDVERAKQNIGRMALLEFKLVDDGHSLDEALKGNVPEGDYIAKHSNYDRTSGRRYETQILLKSKTMMTGGSLKSARVAIGDRFGGSHIEIEFDAQGAKDFDRITGENKGKHLAILLDGVVQSAPVIQERISGGRAQITGAFTDEEATDLAKVLRAGSLPAPVSILEERTVGPSLGQDSIDKGIWSAIIGAILVAVFMVVYYNLSGMVADLALILNVVILLGVLAACRATLTLPGIAGIVLIIGMSVDANVLIFERIREELRTGKTPRAAVEAGYTRAFLTIFDTNVNALIASLFLFGFGTGPVKGFAVTLSVGIITSLFTAVFVTRIIFDYFVWNRKIKAVSI